MVRKTSIKIDIMIGTTLVVEGVSFTILFSDFPPLMGTVIVILGLYFIYTSIDKLRSMEKKRSVVSSIINFFVGKDEA